MLRLGSGQFLQSAIAHVLLFLWRSQASPGHQPLMGSNGIIAALQLHEHAKIYICCAFSAGLRATRCYFRTTCAL